MVRKPKNVNLSLLVFSLISLYLIITLSPQPSVACFLASGAYFSSCSCNKGCTVSLDCLDCGSGRVDTYDFSIDLSGACTMGYYSGSYYRVYCDGLSFICRCGGPEAKWNTFPSYNGQTCKRRSGVLCDVAVREGKWDAADSKCVVCNGKIESGYFNCNGDYSGDQACESACGADYRCDEILPGSYLSDDCTSSYLEVNRYCNSNCQYSSTIYYCNADNCGAIKSCGGTTYYCIYDNGWKWSTSEPENFCCVDDDCPAKDNVKGKCDSPRGTDNPETPGYTYRCYWKPCEKDSDCVSGTKCYCRVCSSTHTSAGCPAGQCCDRDYGGSGIGSCVGKGTIRNIGGKSYLCDPPEEDSINENQKLNLEVKIKEVYHPILNFFAYFSHQR